MYVRMFSVLGTLPDYLLNGGKTSKQVLSLDQGRKRQGILSLIRTIPRSNDKHVFHSGKRYADQ